MGTVAATLVRLAVEVAAAHRIAYPLAELNDLLIVAPADDIENLPPPSITDRYRLNCVTAMVEVAAYRAGVVPPFWTAAVRPLDAPVFVDASLNLRAHPVNRIAAALPAAQHLHRFEYWGPRV